MVDQTLIPSLVVDRDYTYTTSAVLPTYFFALIDEMPAYAEFDEDIHAREDLKVFEFHRKLTEGDFPMLDLVVKNPFTGLLNIPQWIFFSWYDSVLDEIVPLFLGRLVAVPSNLQDTTLTLTYRSEGSVRPWQTRRASRSRPSRRRSDGRIRARSQRAAGGCGCCASHRASRLRRAAPRCRSRTSVRAGVRA
mgnify:CR=1 FL=1